MNEARQTLLLISGPVGVGKSTVGRELSRQLSEHRIVHSMVDLDALACTFPRGSGDPYGHVLALQNLGAVWRNCKRAGSNTLIVPRVIESAQDAAAISKAVDIPNALICRLSASNDTLLHRVRARELGSGLEWHECRAIELGETLEQLNIEDFVVNTDGRSVAEIAGEVRGQVCWA